MIYDCAIIGGGFAGLQAAIQLGRYRHRILVLDAGEGRSSLCRCYHNLLGWPEGVSGEQLRRIGRQQAEQLGVAFADAYVTGCAAVNSELFELTTASGQNVRYHSKRLLLSTGVQDRIALPQQDKLRPCFGISLFVCPDCDGYEVYNKPVLVLGSGDAGAAMALALHYWTPHVEYINHERAPIQADYVQQLADKAIVCLEREIVDVAVSGSRLQGVMLDDGQFKQADQAFIAFGGNQVRSELAAQLGIELLDNAHIEVAARTKLTSRKHVWAAGDVTAHSEQAIIAMGDGAQAAIWIHKSLIT
ncbi:NAD(P)/FAD-dependent oxidoreductase [Paenibacillaceae bacterium]|nr:NAD(P)/FAD-dependent oxidoreductase [Paenibacillaceae bacterium]